MLRRGRGLLLRFAQRRRLAIVTGLALAIPSAWVEMSRSWDAWWVSGAALVCGATGVALVWAGLTGRAPDFVDPNRNR